jgi:lipopolysaccharide export system protein LptA
MTPRQLDSFSIHSSKVRRTILFVLMAVAIAGVSARAQSRQPITATGDTLVGGQRNGVDVEQIVGHVQFAQGALYGSADRAIRYMHEPRIDLIGNVEIHQDTLALYAPSVTYDGTSRTAHAEDGVRLTDRDVTVRSQSADYDADNQVARLHTGVSIAQPGSTSHANELTYYRSTQTTVLIGNVYIKSDSGTLQAERVTNSRALDETIAEGDVEIKNDSLQLFADWFYDAKTLHRSNARGHVTLLDHRRHITLFGDTLARFTNTNYSIVPRNPLLLSVDTSRSIDSLGNSVLRYDTMFVKSRVMEAYQGDSIRFTASDSVRVLRGNFSAAGERVHFDDRAGLMTLSRGPALTGQPRERVWNDSTEVDADSIALHIAHRVLERVDAVGHAFSSDPEPSDINRLNQLEGNLIIAYVENDSLKKLLDVGSALSLYFLTDNTKPNGVNRASGDSIRMDFQSKQVRRVTVISGAEGEYFPERFVTGRETAFRLSGFERNLSLRPRREDFVIPWVRTPHPQWPLTRQSLP